MVKSISEAISASITSPEQGAQQECNSSFFSPLGNSSFSRLNAVLSIVVCSIYFGCKINNFILTPKNSYLCAKDVEMKQSFGFLMVMVVSVLVWSGCIRNDDEPPVPTRPISRLCLSIQDYETDATEPPIDNVSLIDPADGERMSAIFNHDSGARGGSGIHFSPQAKKVFHASLADTLIYM